MPLDSFGLEAFLEFMHPLAHLYSDATCNEIRINANGTVFIERDGVILRVPARITDDELLFAAGSLAGSVNQPFNEANPRLDCRLPDGTRIALTHPPLTERIAVLVRRFPVDFSIHELIERGTLTSAQADYLLSLLLAHKNLVISGATRSGKTTFLRALLNELPRTERLVLIEDPAELHLRNRDVRDIHEIECRPETTNAPSFTPIEAVRSALRYSPDRIIVGEIRGAEATAFVDALNTGHGGSATSIHGFGGLRTLVRLATLVQRGDPQMPYSVVVPLVADSVQCVAHLHITNGKRVLTEIIDVLGVSDDRLRFNTKTVN